MSIPTNSNDDIYRSPVLIHIEFPFTAFDTLYGAFLCNFLTRAVRIDAADMTNSFMWVVSVCFVNTPHFMSRTHFLFLLFV